MSPWKVLGWLLVALLCLLLTAGAYGLALLWGWSLPSVWWLAAIAGAGAGVALIIFLFRTMRDDTHEPAAPLPVELPSERLPRWLLLDGGGLFPHLPGILESAGRPLLSDGAAENAGSVGLWSTAHAHWIAVDFSAPHLSGERKGNGGEGNTPDKAPSLPMWDQLLDDKAVRRWLSPPAGVVLCIGAESLSGHGDDTAAFMRQRLLTVRNRLGNAPVCLLVTGLEHAPGLSRLARHFTTEISIGRNALHAPLGWFMPVRRPWAPMPRWAADGVREGMNGLTAALDSLVRCSESGIPAPGGPAFLLEGALRQLASPLASFAAGLGDGLGGIFWAASPPAPSAFQQATRLSPVMKDAPPTALRSSASAPFSVPGGAPLATSRASQPSATVPAGSRFTPSSGIAAHPLFVRELLLETLPASQALPATGRRARQRAVCWTAAILFAVTAGVALYRGGERSQTLLPDMIRFEDHLPRAASIAELDGLIAEFHKLERGCSGTVRLYGAPKKRLERLRVALRERLTASLPESGDTDRWINDLMIWAAARPGVETLRFRAPDGTVLASVDGAATASGRKAAARFLDNVSAFASQSNILPEQDTPQHTGASDSITERVEALRLRYRASTFAAWYAAGQCLLDAVQAPGIEPRTLLPTRHVPLTPRDLLGPNDPCSAFLAAAERELRSAEGPLPVWVASLRDALCPAAYAAARKRNPAVRNGGTPRGAFRRRPPNTRQSGNTVPGPHRVDGLPQRPCRTVLRNGNLRRPRTAGALPIRRGTERRPPVRRRRMARAGRRPRSTKPGPAKRSAAPLAHARTVAVRRRNRHSRSRPQSSAALVNRSGRPCGRVTGRSAPTGPHRRGRLPMDIRGGRGATFLAPRSLGICAGLSPRDALSPFPGFPQPAFRNAATHRGLSGILPCAGGVLTSHGQPKSTGLSPRPVLAHGLRRRTSPGGCLQLPRNRPVRLVAGTMRQPDIGDPV